MSLVWVCTYSEKTENAWWPGLLLKNVATTMTNVEENGLSANQLLPPTIKNALESCTFGFNKKLNDFQGANFVEVFLLVDGRIGLLPINSICAWDVSEIDDYNII